MAREFELLTSTVPEGTCFTTVQDLIDLAAQQLTVNFTDTLTFFNFGSTTPDVDHQDRPWIRIDGAGRPMGLYGFYNGAWKRYPIDNVDQITMFSGPTSGNFDGTGLGVVGSVWEGYAICNGSNGTIDLRNRFVVAAQEYSGGEWKTTVSGPLVSTGGSTGTVLTLANLPSHDHTIGARSGIDLNGGGGNTVANSVVNASLTTDRAGQVNPDAVVTIPPFFALAYVTWQGYP